jgi:hypothetical protein
MNTNEILAAIDAEIAVLKQARAILTETETADGRSPRVGGKPRKRRKMSAEIRAKMAAAQKKRWAAIRAAEKAAKKVPAKKVAKTAPTKQAVAPKKAAARKSSAVKAKKSAPEKAAAASKEAAPA